MPGKNEFPIGGIFRPKTDYTDQFPLNKKERTELQKNTSRALNELHAQMKGNYEKNTIVGTVKTFDTGYGLRIRDNEGNRIGTAYKGEEVRIIGRQNNVKDSDGIKRNFLRVGVYNNRGKIDEKRSGWVAEDFVEVNPKHIDGLLKNLKKKVEKEDTVPMKKSEKKGSVVQRKSKEEKKGSVLPEKPQRDNNASVLPPKSENEKKGSVLLPKKTEVPKGSVPPKESKQDTAEITQASLEAWKHAIEKNTGIEWVGTTTAISPDLNINGKKVAALISLKLDGMTGSYIIDDGKIYNQSPATGVFYISKKIKIERGEIVKIPVKNTPKTEATQPTPEKSREISAYRIEGDDTIQSVAKRYGMNENELRKLNKLTPEEVAKSGDELLVWIHAGYPLPQNTPKTTSNNRPMGGESPSSEKRPMGGLPFFPDKKAPHSSPKIEKEEEKTEIPFGTPVPDLPGFLHSPYGGIVDVTGLSPGQEVKCPYTGKHFRIPFPIVPETKASQSRPEKPAEHEKKPKPDTIPTPEIDKKDIDRYTEIAYKQIEQGKYREAKTTLAIILLQDPDNASAHYLLGQTFFHENNFDEANRSFKKAISIDSNRYKAHHYLGIIAHKKGDTVLAEEELKKASEMNPKDGNADYNLAILYASLKTPKIDLAKKHYNDALKKGVAPDAQLQKVFDYISKTSTPQPIPKPEEKPSQPHKIPTKPEKPVEKDKKSKELYQSVAKKINEAKTAVDAQNIIEDIIINGNLGLEPKDFNTINGELTNYTIIYSDKYGPQIQEKVTPPTSKPKEEPKSATPEKHEKKTENTESVKEVRNSLGTKLEWTTIEMLKVMSPNARIAYERMIGRARDQGSNFIISDKPRAMFYLFDKEGQSLVRIKALFGEQKGDEIPLSAYAKDDPLEKSRNEKVTPAGIFILGPVYYNEDLGMYAINVQEDWDDDGVVDEEGSIALHPLWMKHPWEKRKEKLESDTPRDNKVSYGCLNIRQEDFDKWVRPNFAQGGLIAITPDKQKLIDTYIPPYTPPGGTVASSVK